MASFDHKQLKALKKQLAKKQKVEKLQAQTALQNKAEETSDKNDFLSAMDGVTKHENNNTHHDTEKPKAKKLQLEQYEEEDFFIHDPLSDELEIEGISPDELMSFCADGIQKTVFKKLRSGSYRISDELDLHGFTIKQAKQILLYYLEEAVQFENCCIRIIHGKGNRSLENKPVLKTYLNHWLVEHQRVLAFHSAKPKDGGTGAVYVILKR